MTVPLCTATVRLPLAEQDVAASGSRVTELED
jgi:hypothetical protein